MQGSLPVVGMVGAGQLARMTHQAAISLGQSLRVLANNREESAAVVAADVRLGDFRDLSVLREFARGCTALTFDHEHVPSEHLHALAKEGIAVYPPPEALLFAQDKLAMRQRLSVEGFPVPVWMEAKTLKEVASFGDTHGWPLVAKAPRGGYDGKGVQLLGEAAHAEPLLTATGSVLLEEKVPMVRELAAVVARSPQGQIAAWPVVETVQEEGICTEVIAPAPDLSGSLAVEAQRLAIAIATSLGVVGVLAVELFEVRHANGSSLCVNELAMRPHNSAHWTLGGAHTSQFEQHLRAVLDYPLGPTEALAPIVVMANLLGGELGGASMDERVHHVFAADPGVQVHLYGKEPRPGRKLGHVTVLDDELSQARMRAKQAVEMLRNGPVEQKEATE